MRFQFVKAGFLTIVGFPNIFFFLSNIPSEQIRNEQNYFEHNLITNLMYIVTNNLKFAHQIFVNQFDVLPRKVI